MLEKFFAGLSNTSLSAATNLLLTGVKGVGKTTLMKGLYNIIYKYKTHVQPIYIDYEQEPNTLIKRVSSCLKPTFEGPFTEDTYDTWALKHKTGYPI
jgi:hypothetical protein